jgi:SNF2 family DNA or RNA helicase
LHYFLQARDNPDLLVSAAEIWQSSRTILRIGNRRLDQPQERLLAGLGIASRLFEPIERSLRTPHPEYAELTTQEAHRFLREMGPLLESGGFGLRLPDWWDGSNRMRLGVRLRLYGDKDIGDNDIDATYPDRGSLVGSIRYTWELALGGQQISQEEFSELVGMQTPLVQVRGNWIELEPVQVRAAREFMDRSPRSGTTSLLRAMRVAQHFLDGDLDSVPALHDVFDDSARQAPAKLDELTRSLLLEAVEVEGWLQNALVQLRQQRSLQELFEPESFIGVLRPYQRRGVGWLMYLRQLGLGACLADDMGLGKTIQAIALLLHVRANRNGAVQVPSLLICPTSVVANWKHEIERFAPDLRPLIHHGSGRLTGEEFVDAMQRHDLAITSFGTARRDIDLLTQFHWDDLILDEAQNIKNPRAKQTQAIRKLRARNRIALTGTPVENRLSELWSIMEYLNAGYLGDRERFRRSFIVPIERYNDDSKAAELRRLVQPFLLRRLKTDPTVITDLPEKNEMVVYCTMTDEQIHLYEMAVQEALAKLHNSDGIRRRGLLLALLTRLKQITNHPAQFLKTDGPLPRRSGKLDRVTEMLEEAISVGDHALVFTQFVEMGHLLKNHFVSTLGTEVLFLHGGTTARRRDQMVQSFQSSDGPPIFVLSLRAGGSGLNLTRANHVFHYDRWWNPAVENQATDRAFRIGQTRNVQVHKFVVSGTLEDHINDMIESKQALAHTIVGSGEEWLADLDTDQLRDLLVLRHTVP